MHDTLKRRIRFAPPQSLGKKLEITERDIAVFNAIHRHGHLPTNYLFPYSGRKDFNDFQHRLTDLFNEGYLMRPAEQFNNFHARYQFITYDLTKKSEALITPSKYLKRTDPFVHRLMGACVMSSMEMCLDAAALKFVGRHDILSRHDSSMRLEISPKALIPDELFGIGYGDSHRFFAVEIDRATEPIHRTTDQTDFGKKLVGYIEVMERRLFEEWGIPKLMVLTVTTNETRKNSLMEEMHQLDPKLSKRFLFKTLPTFGSPWKIPPILNDILDGWDSAHGKFDLSKE